jgi:hypothetical protein
VPSETLHRRDAVSELLLKSWDGFTACYTPPPDFLLCRAKEVSAVPSETLHRREAVSEPPWMGLRRVSEGTALTN